MKKPIIITPDEYEQIKERRKRSKESGSNQPDGVLRDVPENDISGKIPDKTAKLDAPDNDNSGKAPRPSDRMELSPVGIVGKDSKGLEKEDMMNQEVPQTEEQESYRCGHCGEIMSQMLPKCPNCDTELDWE